MANQEEVSNLLISQKLDSFIEEVRSWRAEAIKRSETQDVLIQAHEKMLATLMERIANQQNKLDGVSEALQTRASRNDVDEIKSGGREFIDWLRSELKAKASADDVEELKRQVRAWDVINSIGAAALAVIMIFFKH